MKKILLASTALAFASSAAMAAEAVTGSVGGYMFMGVGLSDTTEDNNDELGILRDSEIHLKFSGSSDNGLTFDGRIELEGFTDTDQIDENWGRVRGSFGEVLIGGNDTVGDRYGDVGIIYGPGARIAYYDGFANGDMPQGGSGDGNDSAGIQYATPNFSGFTAAIGYQPNWSSDGAGSATRPGDSGYIFSSAGPGSEPKDVISVAANYRGDFESFGFAIGGDYTVADDDDLLELWSVGGEVSFSGFTVGVHYENDETSGGEEDIAIGLEYKTGPWTFGGGYSHTEDASCATCTGTKGDIDSAAGWVVYDISPGVRWTAGLEWGDQDGQGGDDRYDAKTFLDIRF